MDEENFVTFTANDAKRISTKYKKRKHDEIDHIVKECIENIKEAASSGEDHTLIDVSSYLFLEADGGVKKRQKIRSHLTNSGFTIDDVDYKDEDNQLNYLIISWDGKTEIENIEKEGKEKIDVEENDEITSV